MANQPNKQTQSMIIKFSKYQGAGNDFIMIDNRNTLLSHTEQSLLAGLCHRRFGIGADGLILLENCPTTDFKMVYFNADGYEGSMCGNGGRCVVAFAHSLGLLAGSSCRFMAIDGLHKARLVTPQVVNLQMQAVDNLSIYQNDYVLDTGSPHYVRMVKKIDQIDVFSIGRSIRYSPQFKEEGINVNFVETLAPNTIKVATYERGVENETYACGTGVVAASIVYAHTQAKTGQQQLQISTKGGPLQVAFTRIGQSQQYQQIWLQGGAAQVFEGVIDTRSFT